MAACVVTPNESAALDAGVEQLRRDGIKLIETPSRVHPTVQGILQSFADMPAQVKRADYVARLIKFDWAYEYSDDGAVYRAARAELEALSVLQLEVDPDATLWNQAASTHNAFEHLNTRSLKVLTVKPDGERITTYVCTKLSLMAVTQAFSKRHGDGARVEVEFMPKPVQAWGELA